MSGSVDSLNCTHRRPFQDVLFSVDKLWMRLYGMHIDYLVDVQPLAALYMHFTTSVSVSLMTLLPLGKIVHDL